MFSDLDDSQSISEFIVASSCVPLLCVVDTGRDGFYRWNVDITWQQVAGCYAVLLC